MPEPAERAIWPPLPGLSSTLCTSVPVGMFSSGSALPALMSASTPDWTTGPSRPPAPHAGRREDVRLEAVRVVQQGDARRAVRVVLDRGDLGGHAVLRPLEV